MFVLIVVDVEFVQFCVVCVGVVVAVYCCSFCICVKLFVYCCVLFIVCVIGVLL